MKARGNMNTTKRLQKGSCANINDKYLILNALYTLQSISNMHDAVSVSF